MKIAELRYSGGTSIFLHRLLNKKYALPYRVVDAVVDHFAKFLNDDRKLPVIWHQSLLAFVQRYKSDLLQEQKDMVKNLIRQQNHGYFAEEIRRELANSKCRGEGVVQQGSFVSFPNLFFSVPMPELDMDFE